MTRVLIAVSCVSAALLFDVQPTPAGQKLPLKVLYAGNPGSDREKEFLDFLRPEFDKVAPASLKSFTPAEADGYDVVIMDWTSPLGAKGEFHMPPAPQLPQDYARPTIMIGAAGGNIGNTLKLKLSWL